MFIIMHPTVETPKFPNYIKSPVSYFENPLNENKNTNRPSAALISKDPL